MSKDICADTQKWTNIVLSLKHQLHSWLGNTTMKNLIGFKLLMCLSLSSMALNIEHIGLLVKLHSLSS